MFNNKFDIFGIVCIQWIMPFDLNSNKIYLSKWNFLLNASIRSLYKKYLSPVYPMIGRVHNGNSGFNMQNKTCLALQSNCRKGSGTSQHIFVLFSLSRLLLSGMSGVISANIHKNAISASLCRTNLLNIIQETVFLTALSTLSLRWRSPIISLSWFKAAGI